ncbi:hypothetical protein [Haloarcula marismortui]|uniref:Uncharacterized protein n=1 Tax=Haloarcula marismortui (strain ATCC 43049 / DSM 3752 / JCM 8966 / VKM B-1809) TaxID=272569 RepID=A0A4V1EMA8_HALMA|nr:hypothetical protein [Haloarcula marismortui]QCP91901.1 hypothetical protein E6P14_13940 [Haloarcula marismortui ATCC 43049]
MAEKAYLLEKCMVDIKFSHRVTNYHVGHHSRSVRAEWVLAALKRRVFHTLQRLNYDSFICTKTMGLNIDGLMSAVEQSDNDGNGSSDGSGKTRHTNDEPAVICPADGCDFSGANRRIGPHIRMSSGDGHGPKFEVPEHLSVDSAESAGTEKVAMEYPNKQKIGEETRYCPFCRDTFTGQHIMKHLGAKAGRDNHPESPTTTFETEDFAVVETDVDGNITAVLEEGKGDPSILIDD